LICATVATAYGFVLLGAGAAAAEVSAGNRSDDEKGQKDLQKATHFKAMFSAVEQNEELCDARYASRSFLYTSVDSVS
jgi:hypothetical protein